MERNYYVLKNGRLKRKENTIYLENDEGKKAIPVNDINALLAFGEIDLNSKLLVFLAQHKIPVHFFNYYGFYSGTFYPREYLNSGFLLVNQVQHYIDPAKRLELAKEFVRTAIDNILKNLQYYEKHGKDVSGNIAKIEEIAKEVDTVPAVPELMSAEGRAREEYYKSFNKILRAGFEFEKRVRQPPDNAINCLISFGNSLLYTSTLSEIYRTQLNPTVSYLHEPGERRFSLSLDISEVFKPVLVDRVIFNLINNQLIKDEHFLKELNFCYLNEAGRRVFISEYDAKLKTTIALKKLGRSVSYQRLIRIECYKLVKHLIGEEKYEGFRSVW